MIASHQEILEELNLTRTKEYIKNKKIIAASPEEETLCAILKNEPLHIDNIAKKAKMEASRTASILMLMEMKGMIRNLGSGNYVIAR